MKALCIGRSCYQFNLLVSDFASANKNMEVNEVNESSSGAAVTVAKLLGKYNVESYIGSVVGDDTFGNTIKKDLEKVGVHTEYMETAYDKRTTVNFSALKKNVNEKISYIASREKLLLKKTEFPMDPDVIYTDAYDYGASLAALNKYANKITVLGAKVPSQETVELSKYCKYIIANQEFAEWITGREIDFTSSDSLVTVYSMLLNKFVGKQVIVTLADKGALYISNGQIKVMPSLKMEVVDSTGAGNIFDGAVTYALLQGYDLEKAVTFANIAAGLSVSKVGMNESVVDLSEVMNYFRQKYPEGVDSI